MELKEHFMMTLAAPRGSGKSFFVKQLLKSELIDRFDHIVIMCPSLDFNDDYDDFRGLDKFRFISNVTSEIIEDLWNRQAKCKAMIRRKRRDKKKKNANDPQFSEFESEDPDIIECPHVLLILDDIIDSGVVKFRGIVDKVAERGRHVSISLILNSQRISAISRSIRLNADYFIIFKPFAVAEVEQFLDQFVRKKERKAAREIFASIFKRKHQFVMLDNTDKTLKESNAKDFINGTINTITL